MDGSRPDIWRFDNGPGGVALPIAEIVGTSPGPKWLLSAGVHGDEYEGPEIIRRVLARLSDGHFAGSVMALPVMNPMAYAAGSRCTPEDGGNLNRAFPGNAHGTVTEGWADWLWQSFIVRCDRLIDLHAGGVTWQFEPVAGMYTREDLELAECLGLTLWHLPDTPGVLSREFRRARGPAIGAELGYGGVRDEALVDRMATSIIELIGGRGRRVPGPVYQHHDVLARSSGEWIAARYVASEIAEGEVLGVVHNWMGDVVEEVLSPLSGRVLAVRRLVSVQAGDLVAVVGTP